MNGLIRAEFRKLTSTQVWFWLLLASMAIAAVSVIVPIATANNLFELNHRVHGILAAGNSSYIAVFVLGVLAVTTEFRYQTITPTVLVTPSRWTLISAKLITFAIVGVLYSLACVVVGLLIAVPWLSARHADLALSHNYTAIISGLVVVALFALVGLGAGALLKNQIVAVVVGLLFLLVIENLIVAIPGVKVIFPYLPTGLLNAVITSVNADRTINNVQLLPVWGGVVGLVIWGLGMALLGAGITMNRDIT